jgi:hypothetical protein
MRWRKIEEGVQGGDMLSVKLVRREVCRVSSRESCKKF